jgi:hypothetical protein
LQCTTRMMITILQEWWHHQTWSFMDFGPIT